MINKTKKCVKIVSNSLTQEQEENRRNICSDVMERLIEEIELLTNYNICDGNWIFRYKLERKRQLMLFFLRYVGCHDYMGTLGFDLCILLISLHVILICSQVNTFRRG